VRHIASFIRIGIAGAGRMGQAIARQVNAAEELALAGIWGRGEDLEPIAHGADVLVDFSLPQAFDEVLAAAVKHRTPIVCGVSGLSDEQLGTLQAAAEQIGIVYDRNMSLGVAVLEDLVRQAAASLGREVTVEIHETHHVHKLDAPSGTALKLGEAVVETLSLEPSDIHYESERRGEVPGDHTVILATPTEQLRLGHSVTTRDVFAAGALRAARWLCEQPRGRYSMRDVLGLGQKTMAQPPTVK
jgi:4-hydroxy-tetrahydrodipicolinate reductase